MSTTNPRLSFRVNVNPFRRWRLSYSSAAHGGAYRAGRWALWFRSVNFYGPWLVIRIGPWCWTFAGGKP